MVSIPMVSMPTELRLKEATTRDNIFPKDSPNAPEPTTPSSPHSHQLKTIQEISTRPSSNSRLLKTTSTVLATALTTSLNSDHSQKSDSAPSPTTAPTKSTNGLTPLPTQLLPLSGHSSVSLLHQLPTSLPLPAERNTS
jgi:hypothetical protein